MIWILLSGNFEDRILSIFGETRYQTIRISGIATRIIVSYWVIGTVSIEVKTIAAVYTLLGKSAQIGSINLGRKKLVGGEQRLMFYF